MADRVTRPSNANAHPGLVDRYPARRSKEEVQAKKKAKAAGKARAELEKQADINKVAAMEKAEKQREKVMASEANDPFDSVTHARVKRMRPDGIDEGSAKKLAAKRLKGTGTPAGEADKLADAKLATFLDESLSSGSDYQEASDEDSEPMAQSDEEVDEESDTTKKRKKGKKVKKGLVARDRVSAAVAAMSDNASPTVGTTETPTRPQSKRSTRTPHETLQVGVPPRLQKGLQAACPVQSSSRACAASTTLGQADSDSDTQVNTSVTSHARDPSRSSTLSQSFRGAMSERDVVPPYRYGGFVPDDSAPEQYDGGVDTSEFSKYKSITKITAIHAAPSASTTNRNAPKKNKLHSYDDLPAGTKDRFKKEVIPLSLETTGALKPWVIPDDKAIVDIWNIVFGMDHHIGDDDIESKFFLVAKALIKRAISTWLHKFAESVERALATEFI